MRIAIVIAVALLGASPMLASEPPDASHRVSAGVSHSAPRTSGFDLLMALGLAGLALAGSPPRLETRERPGADAS